jgi:hypothetical protein
VVEEYDAWVNAATPGALPAGSVTYRVYAELNDPTDEVSSVFAIQDCHQLSITTTTGFFNDATFGGLTAANINPGLFGFFPGLEADTYVSVGALDQTNPQSANITALPNLPPDFFTQLAGTANGLPGVMNDGAWFSAPAALPTGPNNRVFLGQFTTDGDFTFQINVQVFDEGDGINGRIDYVHTDGCQGPGVTSGFEQTIPSLTFPLAGCLDNEVTYDMTDSFGDGWNGAIYEVFDNSDPLAPVLVATGDLDGAATGDGSSVGQDIFCLPDGCYELVVGGGGFDGEIGWTLTGVDGGPLTGGAGSTVFSINTASCPVAGCTDATACNFDPAATVDDGSCIASGQANDQCANAIDLGSASTSVVSSNVGACFDTEDGEQSGVFYSFTLNADAEVVIETVDNGLASPFDTQLALFDACGNLALDFNDDGGAGLLSQLSFVCGDLAPGTYLIMVDGFSGAQGDFELSLSIDENICINIPGCTDGDAINFDATATVDDGSCIVPDCDPADDGVAIAPASSESYCYDSNENTTFTYVADNAGDQVIIAINAGTFEVGFDDFTVYDGTSTAAPVLAGPLDGDVSGLVFVSTSGALTIQITSDSSVSCQSGSQSTLEYDVYCGSAAIAGCTDSTACNFDPAATIDDGSCVACADTCVDLVVDGGGFPGEITFDVFDSASNLVYSGTGSDGTVTLCLADGCYTVDMFDSFGDGWNGASIDVQVGGSSIATIDLDSAPIGDGSSIGTDFFDVGGTGSCPVIGCTDATACNFDPAATLDDGSCIPGPCVNDLPSLALALPMNALGTCNGLVGEDLAAATVTAPEGTAFTSGAGLDLWYSFVPMTSGVRLEVNTGDFDALIELQDASNNPLDIEDAVFVNGSEALNIGNLTAGDTYFVRVTSWLDLTGAGIFDICAQSIPDTRCDYGPGPYGLGDTFKADWVASDDYIFNFTADSDGSVYTYQSGGPITTVQFFNVPGMSWGDDYTVEINSVWDLTDGSGSTESIEVLNDEPCTITLDPQPLAQMSPNFNQANAGPVFFGSYILATPWIHGTAEWEWEFVNTDGSQLPIIHLSGSPSRWLQISSVAGIQEGAVYEVRVRPVFASGAPSSYGAVELLAIVGAAGLDTEIETPVSVVDNTAERLEIEDAAAAMIYPNPNNGEMMFVNVNDVPANVDRVLVDIYDLAGKRIVSEQLATTGSANFNVQMPLSNLNSGMYIVNIVVGDEVYTERLTVTK